jgi:Na+/H+ antiporter NhaC
MKSSKLEVAVLILYFIISAILYFLIFGVNVFTLLGLFSGIGLGMFILVESLIILGILELINNLKKMLKKVYDR